MVHILPEKIAHKRHHPQFEAIRTLCLLSLVFGGLLWPIAWLWAYSKPVHAQDRLRHRQARMHDEEYAGETEARRPRACTIGWRASRRQGCPAAELKTIRADIDALEAKARSEERPVDGNPPARHLLLLRLADLHQVEAGCRGRRRGRSPSRSSRSSRSRSLLLLLNIFAPTTSDVRVVKYVVPVVSQVRGPRHRGAGREQPAGEEGRRRSSRIDPTPYQNEVHSLEAQAGVGRGRGRRRSRAAGRSAGEAGRRAVERARS